MRLAASCEIKVGDVGRADGRVALEIKREESSP